MTINRVVGVALFMALTALPAVADGSIAVDLSPGVEEPGYGIGHAGTRLLADREAVKLCGAANPVNKSACKIVVRYEQCAAVAVSPTYHVGHASGATLVGARIAALFQCGFGCQIVVADCVP